MFAEQPRVCNGYPAKKKIAIASHGSLEISHPDCTPADQALCNVTECKAMQALLRAELRPSFAAEVIAFFGEAAPKSAEHQWCG